mmetsp:Transcript_25611/g.55667  ORF Transcript_25611/g.55667 Transcript_25611/m.55667 type:complete len:212 (-) Transcript_25611:16-651(-)
MPSNHPPKAAATTRCHRTAVKVMLLLQQQPWPALEQRDTGLVNASLASCKCAGRQEGARNPAALVQTAAAAMSCIRRKSCRGFRQRCVERRNAMVWLALRCSLPPTHRARLPQSALAQVAWPGDPWFPELTSHILLCLGLIQHECSRGRCLSIYALSSHASHVDSGSWYMPLSTSLLLLLSLPLPFHLATCPRPAKGKSEHLQSICIHGHV